MPLVSESTALPRSLMDRTKRSDWLESPRPTCVDLQNTAASAGLVLEVAHTHHPPVSLPTSRAAALLDCAFLTGLLGLQYRVLCYSLLCPYPCHASPQSSAQTQPSLVLSCHRKYNKGQHDKENTEQRPGNLLSY